MIFLTLGDVQTLHEKLSLIERRDIDGTNLQFPNHLLFLSEFHFHRLRGKPQLLGKNGINNQKDDIAEPLLIGMFASQQPFCYVIEAYPDHIEIYFGSKTKTTSDDSPVYKTILEGYWGHEFIQDAREINIRIKDLSNYSVCGAITGIPSTLPIAPSIRKIVPSDHWMKSLQGDRWTYIVNGFCIQRNMLTEYESQIISEIALLKTRTIREDILYEDKRLAEHYQSLLEANLKRLENARLTGAWQVGIYFFATNEPLISQGLGIISAHLGGKKSMIQPIRTHFCYKDNGLKTSFSNLLISSEVSPLLSIPEEEVPGYTIQKVALFDTDTIEPKGSDAINIGLIIRNQIVTDNTYKIVISDLTKHGLIAGVTGSGKTTTCFYILKQLKQRGIPFLVIESAKSEYRQLLNDPLFKDMLIFTLGDETPDSSAPFRINPFEVPEGILVQTHLDYLKSLFRASFVMYAPMPYVLEEALHEVYRDKGWNLSANSNERGISEKAFPTLTDLYEKIDEVVSRLGYDDRLSKDIMAGLKTRINNLRLGGKGLMLDTYKSVPIGEIMKRSVLLELKKLGNDDEKSFLIGLVLTRIYEYYEATAHNQPTKKGLRHLTLIEEAHRLLKHVPLEASEFDGNVRSKAVETFCNMLSEIRAYGEGVIVSEQIPNKLARDVMKNTNLKIMHRLVAKDDRDIMGDTMNLSDEQKTFVTTIDKGKAAVFAEGMDNPFLIYVPLSELPVKSIMNKPVTNRFLYQHMKENFYYDHKWILFKYRECSYCGIDRKNCEYVRERIKMILSERKPKEIFNRLFLTVALEREMQNILTDIDRLIRENIPIKNRDEMKCIQLCFIIQAIYLLIEPQGRMYGYSFKQAEDSTTAFIDSMKSLIFDRTLDNQAHANFIRLFTELRTKTVASFIGCFVCNRVCYYRFEAEHFIKDKNINADFNYAVEKIKNDYDMWVEIAKLSKAVAHKLIHSTDSTLLMGVALCYLAQKVAQLGYSPKNQEMVMKSIKHVFEKGVVAF